VRSALHTAAHFLTDTNLFIAAGAAFFCSSTYWFYGLPANAVLVAAVFCGTLFTYNFQRWAGDLNQSAAYRPFKKVAMMGAFAAMAICLWQLPPRAWVVLGIAGVLSVAYAVPVLSFRGKRCSLRHLPYLKAWIIVAVWLLVGVATPLIAAVPDSPTPDPVSVVAFFLQQGAFIFALTTAFDIRDLPMDLPAQKTLPQTLGVARTRRLAVQMMWFSLLASMSNYLFGYFSLSALAAHALSVWVGIILLRGSRPERPPLFFTLLVDGVLVVQGVVVWWSV